MTDWLPPIVPFDGDWEGYCDQIHEIFESDLRAARFFGLRVGRRREPEVQGKADGFWHVTTEGFASGSDDRLPDMRRCERISWIRPMIDAAGTDRVHCWLSDRPPKKPNVVIALPDFSHVVILARRRGTNGAYMMLVTAFPPRGRRRAQFESQHRARGEYRP